MGIKAYLPTPDLSKRNAYFLPHLFRYDQEKDQYICSEGQFLPLFSRWKIEQVLVYQAKVKICNACPVKANCSASESGRYIFR
jgi:hypothetical protein